MVFVRQIIIGFLLFFGVGFSHGQEEVLQTVSVDSATAVSVDTFNYVLPPEDRPHQMLQLLLNELEAESVSTSAFLQTMLEKGKMKGKEANEGRVKSERPQWVLFSVFLLFLSIAIIKLIFPGDFTMIVQAYYQERTLQQVSKEDNMLTSWPYIFLYLIFSLALGLFIVLIESAFVRYDVLNLENYLRTSIIVAALFILKIVFIRFISFVFEIERLVREYITVLYLVYFNSMLFLMPFLLMIVFVPTAYFNIILILFSVIVTILFAYRFFRTALRLFGTVRFSLVYLILYLCALEVAPILILIKTLSK